MSHFDGLITALFPRTEPRHQRDEAYLAAATDLHDLERRQQVVDQHGRHATPDLTYSLGLR